MRKDSNAPDKASARPQSSQKNEGEGNKTAAREYNAAQHQFVQSGKVDKAAAEARDAVDGAEGAELKKAEDKGRAHAKR